MTLAEWRQEEMVARAGTRIAGALTVAVLSWAGGASAAVDTWCVQNEANPMPCSFQVSAPGLQMSNGAIKFQGRISQAKIPVADGQILQVSVSLVDAKGQPKCTQPYGDVRIMNGVLNLDFQPPGCSINDAVAQNPDLAFQLTLNGVPLKAIPLGTVPYALKSNYAVTAQESHQADVAAQAHYAHRATADRATFGSDTVGKGYFDFYTHPQGGTRLYSTLSAYASFANDGFLQWTPIPQPPNYVSPPHAGLHICAKGLDDGIAPLDELYLESTDTQVNGAMTVNGPLTVEDSTAPADLVCRGSADFRGTTNISVAVVSSHLTVNANTDIGTARPLDPNVPFTPNVLNVNSDVNFYGAVTLPQRSISSADIKDGQILPSHTSAEFHWAQGRSKGGAATDLDCDPAVPCVSSAEIGDGEIKNRNVDWTSVAVPLGRVSMTVKYYETTPNDPPPPGIDAVFCSLSRVDFLYGIQTGIEPRCAIAFETWDSRWHLYAYGPNGLICGANCIGP